MSKGKAKFKINKDVPELICSKCSAVIKEGKYFTEEEQKAFEGEIKLPPQFCDECLEKMEKY